MPYEDSGAIARDAVIVESDLFGMRITYRTWIAAMVIGASAGCSSDAGNGALLGGGIGALAGGIIGNQSGHSMGGALIGGAIGAGTGALIGHASDENKAKQHESYDDGYSGGQRQTSRGPAPTSGYYSSSETSRSSLGNGGYSNGRTVTETSSTSTTYYR